MADAESPERLPVGWTEQIASTDGGDVKFYYNVITRQKFYSKADLLRHVELGIPSQGTRQQTRALKNGIPDNRIMPVQPETNNTPEWLPQGWIMEVNAMSNGKKYKTYIDPLTGRKFNSRPAIMRYLNNDESYDPTSEQTFQTGESTGSDTPPSQARKRSHSTLKQMSSRHGKAEIIRYEAKGLPPGWIKEIKIEKTRIKIRKDPYYTDPDTKYVFRSHRDALRYLKTKDMRACATKPRKREEITFLSDDLPITEEKQSADNTTEECAEKEENHAPTSGQPPRTPGSKRKQGRPLASPSTDNIIQQGKRIESIVDSTKLDDKKVITEEAAANNLERQPLDRFGGDSSLDPCLEFAYKTLRGDSPLEANNNVAAQSYNHQQQRPPVNVGFPSFSDYARRQT